MRSRPLGQPCEPSAFGGIPFAFSQKAQVWRPIRPPQLLRYRGWMGQVAGLGAFDENRWLSRRHKDTEMNENAMGTFVVDCAVELHRDLGPGLLETVYELVLARAVARRGLRVQRQVGVAIEYLGEALMRDGITWLIHGNLEPDPPCLGASVREEFNPAVPVLRSHSAEADGPGR